MKAAEVLDCIMYLGISGADIVKLEIPAEGGEWKPKEELVKFLIGDCPPTSLEQGVYIAWFSCHDETCKDEYLCNSTRSFVPSAMVKDSDGCYIYLYKLED